MYLPPELVSHLHVNDLWKHLPRASAAQWPLKRSQTYPGVLDLGLAPAETVGSWGRCLKKRGEGGGEVKREREEKGRRKGDVSRRSVTAAADNKRDVEMEMGFIFISFFF